METPIQAELICYDVNGIHIVFGVTKEKALKLFHFSCKNPPVKNHFLLIPKAYNLSALKST